MPVEENLKKTVAQSRTTQVQIIMPAHINGDGRLFGGQLVEWIDTVAAVVARRHAGCDVTTVTIDNLQFQQAGLLGETVVLEGFLTWVGHTSMEVCVETYVENLQGHKRRINTAYLVMVAVRHGRPVQVPGLRLETPQEQEFWEAGTRRSDLRHQRRVEQF